MHRGRRCLRHWRKCRYRPQPRGEHHLHAGEQEHDRRGDDLPLQQVVACDLVEESDDVHTHPANYPDSSILAFIDGWISQWYANGFDTATLNDLPGAMIPESSE